jgi:hypothetical protein
MLRIEDALYNKPNPGRDVCKPHLVTNDVKDVVLADLRQRYGEQKVISTVFGSPDKSLPEEAHIDFGGMVLQSWEPFAVRVGGVLFTFYAHQLDQVYRAVHHAIENPRAGFCKVFTHWFVFCCRRELLLQLLEEISRQNRSIRERADKELAKFEKARAEIQKKTPFVRFNEPGKHDA